MTLNELVRTTDFAAAASALKAAVQGDVVLPSDPTYDRARFAWNVSTQHQPAVVVMAHSAADVVAAVRFARDLNLEIAVQGTGHGISRSVDGAMLINTAQMKSVRVNTEAQTAWVEAGMQWGGVLEAAQAVGLAPLLGSSPMVGVVGYTLGGGMGWLARKYGFAADSVRRFEVVTADGHLLQASESENSDLFWALRGGGGAFAIVTGMEIQLYPVSTVYAGNLFYPADSAKQVLQFFRAWTATMPEEMTSSIALANFPPLPQIPEPVRGKSVVIVRALYCGDVADGRRYVQQWLEWQQPMMNSFDAMSFANVAAVSNDPVDPMPAFASGAWLKDLSDEAIDTLVKFGVSVSGSSPLVMTEVRHAGGALARGSERLSAIGHRDAPMVLSLIGVAPTAEVRQFVQGYVDQLKAELAPHMNGVYMNFLDGKQVGEQTKLAYSPESYERLIAIKAKYDPDNVLSYGFNIPTRA